jgi:hypothetical protein
MSRSHIRAVEDAANSLRQAFRILERDSARFIFLDLSFPLSIRSVQVMYPEIKWTRLDYRQKDTYEIYHGLEEDNREGAGKMLKRAVIVSTPQFKKRYLDDIPTRILYEGELTIFVSPPGEANILLERYYALLLRS